MPNPSSSSTQRQTHYAILNLPSPLAPTRALTHNSSSSIEPRLSQAAIKQAYRRALLEHHPDKNKALTTSTSNGHAQVTIDDITRAFEVLNSDELRRAYDRELALGNTRTNSHAASRSDSDSSDTDPSGIIYQALDLSDLTEEQTPNNTTTWTSSCRCGLERAYVLSEEELEEESDKGMGEVWVACQGCSLWIVVEFGVDDGDEEEEEEERGEVEKG